MNDNDSPETISRRLGKIEHLINEVLERHARASVKDRAAIERAIEKVGLELSNHRNLCEGTSFFTSERILEKNLDNRLFERDQDGWEVVGLSATTDRDIDGKSLYLVIFRQSAFYAAEEIDGAVKSSK